MPNVYDVLEVANQQTDVVQVLEGYYVRFQSTTGGATYVSTAPTAANGSFQILNVNADTYKVLYALTSDGPWKDTGWQYLVLANLGVAGVDTTTNQTIAGIKTFTSRPVLPNDYMDLIANQTVAGIKTFTSRPVLPGGDYVDFTSVQTISGAKTFSTRPVLPNDYVDLVANQTIAGTKTFSTRPIWPTDNYHAEVYATGTTTLVTSAFTKILMAGEEADPNNNFAASTYTCPVAGRYLVTSAVETSDASEGNCILTVFKNGVEVKTAFHQSYITATVAAVVRCAANDTLDIRYFTNAATPGVASATQSRTHAQYTYMGPL